MQKFFRNIAYLLIIKVFSFINNANGDVYLTDRTINNEAEFINFITQNLQQELSTDRFSEHIEWQMPGCAVFFPAEDPTSQKVYVAKKRQYTDSEPLVNNTDNLLKFSSNMHTERQLAIVALEDRICKKGLSIFKKQHKRNFFPLTFGAKLPLLEPPRLTVNEKIKGTLCIYTEFPPCRNNADDNCNYPCIAYYDKLANTFPNVTFHIFFSNFNNISEKSATENYISPSLLFREAFRLITHNKITSGFQIKCCLENTVKQKIAEASLNPVPSAISITTDWTATGDNNKACAAVAKIINPLLKSSTLTSDEKSELFNNIYGNNAKQGNIRYYCIQ